MRNESESTESLLAVPIKDDEIFELLERLAATEEMFKEPVSTIRDVVELTEASPTLVARLLGEMRGPGELEQMVGRLDEHDRRLLEVEHKFSKLEKQKTDALPEARVNRPNIVGSTVQKGRVRAPRVEEPPPATWVENKQKIENERNREWQKRFDESHEYLVKFWIYVAVSAIVAWIIYSAVTAAVTSH